MESMRRVALSLALLVQLATLTTGCEKIPADRYGVDRLRFEGMEAMDGRALALCLATRERGSVAMDVGVSVATECGEPPFDSGAPRWRLFRWAWTSWPVFDREVFDRDLDRVVRWYQARGYPDARVAEVRMSPHEGLRSDQIDETTLCEHPRPDEGCELEITVVIEEGEPILVDNVQIGGLEELEPAVAQAIREAVVLVPGQPFDETLYERSKIAIARVLAGASHARAVVAGRSWMARQERKAVVAFRVDPGPPCVFGEVVVEAPEGVSVETIRGVASIEAGEAFDPTKIGEARRAVHALGAFSTVQVTPVVPTEGNTVDVRIEVRLVRDSRWSLGGGVQAGDLDDPDEVAQGVSVNQWDIHLIGRWEHRNFLGGLRRLTLEEKPRLVFNSPFPTVDRPDAVDFGNTISLRFVQPAFLEPRTYLNFSTYWDYGPDPYEGFTRHEFRGGLDLRRAFWDHRIQLIAGLHLETYQIPGGSSSATDDDKADWFVMYWQQVFRLDMRDRPIRTRSGFYTSLVLQEAGHGLGGDWDYIRIAPDVRGYVPLGSFAVFAMRARVGYNWITKAPNTDPASALQLGPTTQRFRAGGSTSSRGFLPTWVGDGERGGVNLWGVQAELRIPITQDLWTSVFADAGDVSRTERFRWRYPQMNVGFGIRYFTIIGPIRLDVGFRLPNAQTFGSDDRYRTYCEDPADPGGADILCTDQQIEDKRGTFFGSDVAGAISLTIGESF